MKPMFSIVTVCRNSAAVLPNALASLRAQSCTDREWVVVDGGSNDGTFEMVLASAEPLGTCISEPDSGIYDAMNKGWRRASGDIVYFLNSDDMLFDANVLARVAAAFAREPATELLVGEVIYQYPDQLQKRRSFRHIDSNSLVFGDLCHQSVFVGRALFERIGGFDQRFTINADYDWLIRAFRSGARVQWLDLPVARFTTGGLHRRNFANLVAERRVVRLQYVSPFQLWLGLMRSRTTDRVNMLLGRGRAGQLPLAMGEQ